MIRNVGVLPAYEDGRSAAADRGRPDRDRVGRVRDIDDRHRVVRIISGILIVPAHEHAARTVADGDRADGLQITLIRRRSKDIQQIIAQVSQIDVLSIGRDR